MQVSGIGGAALGGAGLGAGAGAATGGAAAGSVGTSSNVPTSAPVITTADMPAPGGGTILAGSIAASASALSEVMQGFDLAQLIFALLVMEAMNQEDEDSGSAGMGFLAGFAMAGALSQSMGNTDASAGTPAVSGSTGGNLDVSV